MDYRRDSASTPSRGSWSSDGVGPHDRGDLLCIEAKLVLEKFKNRDRSECPVGLDNMGPAGERSGSGISVEIDAAMSGSVVSANRDSQVWRPTQWRGKVRSLLMKGSASS